MDMSRFTEIDGREVFNRLLDGLEVYSTLGNKFYMKDNKLWMDTKTSSGMVHLTINETISRTWYVKKPFDVRKEMLERPNEWVGAFKDPNDRWHKVGFDNKYMQSVETPFASTVSVNLRQGSVSTTTCEELDKCIPLEEVPEGEWQ